MTAVFRTRINDRWDLMLPEHRAVRPEWPVWERERLASMHEHLTKPVEQWERRNGFALGVSGRETRSSRPVIIDVGAEEGDFPALWSSWGCDVILVEPNPLVWPNIKLIWRANGLRHPLAMFVGFAGDFTNLAPDRDNVKALGLIGPDGWPFCADGEVIGDHGFRHLGQQADETPTIMLDELVQGNHVDAITIDVEGAELRVLHGAEHILRDSRPLVWVSAHTDYEWNDDVYDGVRPADLVEFMTGYDYVHELLAVDHEQHWFFQPKERMR